jgi:hypothetical protein
MQTFKASVQYNDWKGTAAADGADSLAVHEYLETKGLIQPGEFLIATSLWVGEGSVFARAYLFNGPEDVEGMQKALAAITGSIPVREVALELKLDEFLGLFKRFDVMLTWHGLGLEGREYSVTDQ